MGSAKEYENYARECVRLARLPTDPHVREQLLQMAREWMSVVMDEEKVPSPKITARRTPARQKPGTFEASEQNSP